MKCRAQKARHYFCMLELVKASFNKQKPFCLHEIFNASGDVTSWGEHSFISDAGIGSHTAYAVRG
jgi:hypothetical protein